MTQIYNKTPTDLELIFGLGLSVELLVEGEPARVRVEGEERLLQ